MYDSQPEMGMRVCTREKKRNREGLLFLFHIFPILAFLYVENIYIYS